MLRVFLQWDIGINQKMSPCFVCTAVYCANCILSWQNARLHESTTSFNSTELIVNTFLLFLSCFLIPNVCAICVDLLCFAFSTELQQMLPYRCEYLSRSCFFFCYWFYGVAATLLCISYYSYVRTISALIVLSIITAQTLMNHMENWCEVFIVTILGSN